MGGFNSLFVRVPNDQSGEAFAAEVDRLLPKNLPETELIQVQWARGFDWVHIDGFGWANPGEQDTFHYDVLKSAGVEFIVLGVQNTSDVYCYYHSHPSGNSRLIVVCEGTAFFNKGAEEFWEEPARTQMREKYGSDLDDWPSMFREEHVMEAFHLPSPWDNQPPQDWDVEYSNGTRKGSDQD